MKTDKIYFGAAYYHEYMPYERLEEDMKLMKEAGINVIRIAESAWSTWEKQDGVFDFSELIRVIEAAARYDIDVIIGTPTYAIPSWMVRKYPDILALTHKGQELYGHRQNMDITHPKYLFYCERIIRKLMEAVSSYPNVIGYQIDNETRPYDTCSKRAQDMFVEYLKEKFPDIKEFNREFGLDYWSNRIDNWEDFPDIRGTINGSLSSEYKKFQRSLVTNFFFWQRSIIKEYARKDQFVTHNFDYGWRNYSFGIQPEVNQFEAAKALDVAGCDIYHYTKDRLTGAEISFCGAVARALKKDNYLLLETLAQGNNSWLPYEGQLRLQAYSHLANGANSVMYWHWHSIHNAIESHWKGILSHNLKPNATYNEASLIGNEFKNFGNELKNLKKDCKAAIMISNKAQTGLSEFPIDDEIEYNDILRGYYDAFYNINVECDLVNDDEEELSAYKLLIVPALYCANEVTINNIKKYVAEGGTLLMSFKSCFSDEFLKIYADDQPHGMCDVIGGTYDQYTNAENVMVKGDLFGKQVKALNWMELLIPEEGKALASYDHPSYSKYAAVISNTYKKGSCIYVGCHLESSGLSKVAKHAATQAGINLPVMEFPVIKKSGTNDYNKKIHYYFNYSNDNVSFVYDEGEGTSLMDGNTVSPGDKITISAWNLVIVEEDNDKCC